MHRYNTLTNENSFEMSPTEKHRLTMSVNAKTDYLRRISEEQQNIYKSLDTINDL